MKNILLSASVLLLLMACTTKIETSAVDPNKSFSAELQELKDYFQIPGLAVLVQQGDSVLYEDYFGYADVEKQIKVDSTTQFPIASITKAFTGVALFQLIEQGKLSLDDPMDEYLSDPIFGDSILIKHVLSHTSQGEVGKHFYYSYRFGALTPVIEKASGQSFEAYLQEGIFDPLGLEQTFTLTDSTVVTPTMARPYYLDDSIVLGQIEYGLSASAGMVSTVQDMATFSRALDKNLLLKTSSKKRMGTPFQPDLPYGYGIFAQHVEDTNLLWGYGQYDCYSSLLLRVPEKELTLILLANTNLMSDPARLINGDALSSLFALSFVKNYVLELDTLSLFEPEDHSKEQPNASDFYRKKLLAEALSASFMARFDNRELEKSKRLLQKTFALFPDYLAYGDLNLLHTLTFIKSVHFYKELGEFPDFDPQIEAIAEKLLEQDPNNPYAHVYMGSYHDRKGDPKKARWHYEALANARNFSPFWYTAEAKSWLAENE